MADVTPQTGYRDIGDVGIWEFNDAITGTPLGPETTILWGATKGFSRLYLSLSWNENRHHTTGILIPPTNKNNLALRPRGYPEEAGNLNGFAVFNSYADCAKAWLRRLTDPDLPYVNDRTFFDFCQTYHPYGDIHPTTGERNDPLKYCVRACAYINTTLPEMSMASTRAVVVPGLGAIELPSDLGYEIALIPTTQKNQRPGLRFAGGSADWFTIHETGNTRAGANADFHKKYLQMGAPDDQGRPQQLSYHATVDDRKLIILLPFNEIAWHAGDSAGPGNFDSWALELCVNSDANYAKVRSNAEAFASAALKRAGYGSARLAQHNKWSGKDCPHYIRSQGYWPTLVTNVAVLLGETQPDYAIPNPIEEFEGRDGEDVRVSNTDFWWCPRTYTALRETPVLLYAHRDSDPLRAPLRVGEKFSAERWFTSNGEAWAYTEYGSRIPLKDCSPKVSIAAM